MINKWIINNIYGEWIDHNLSSNVYAVVNLKQGTSIDFKGSVLWVKGDPYYYEAAYGQFIRRLSKRIYGKNCYRRSKRVTKKYKQPITRLIPNAFMLEGGPSKGTRYHLNIQLRRPEWLALDKLRSLFLEEWAKTPWAMSDVYFEERTGDCVGYSLKEGPETLLTSSLRF